MNERSNAVKLLGDLANLSDPKHKAMLEDAILDSIAIEELQGLRAVVMEETRLAILAAYNRKKQQKAIYTRRIGFISLVCIIAALTLGLLFFWRQCEKQQIATHIQAQEALCLSQSIDSLQQSYSVAMDQAQTERKRVFWAKAKAEAAAKDKEEDFNEAQANNWAFMAEELSKEGRKEKALRLSEAAYLLNKRNPPTSVIQAVTNAYFVNEEFHFEEQLRHRGAIRHVAVSPNGQYIATASNDKTAKIWSVSGQLIADLAQHTKPVLCVAFSPDSKLLVTASEDETAMVWSVSSGQMLAKLQGHNDDVRSVLFSPDGKKILTASFDQTAKLWAISGSLIKTLEGHSNAIDQAIFSPSGKEILTASWDHTCKLWNVATGKELLSLSQHQDKINSIAFDPKGKAMLTASEDGEAVLWDMAGNILTAFSLHNGGVKTAYFSPSGKEVLTSSDDKTAMIWSRDGQPIKRLSGHAFGLVTASYAPNGHYIFTASTDNILRLWYKDGTLLYEYKGHTDQISTATFSPNSQYMISGGYDQAARTWLTPPGIFRWLESSNVPMLTDEDKKLYGFGEEVKGK